MQCSGVSMHSPSGRVCSSQPSVSSGGDMRPTGRRARGRKPGHISSSGRYTQVQAMSAKVVAVPTSLKWWA